MPVSLGRFSKNRTSGSSPPADAPIPTTKRGGTAVFSRSPLADSPPSSPLRVGLFVIAPSAGSRPPMDASEGKGHAHLVWICDAGSQGVGVQKRDANGGDMGRR